jgi:hypothetical protein
MSGVDPRDPWRAFTGAAIGGEKKWAPESSVAFARVLWAAIASVNIVCGATCFSSSNADAINASARCATGQYYQLRIAAKLPRTQRHGDRIQLGAIWVGRKHYIHAPHPPRQPSGVDYPSNPW